jgi:hypothetical protein
LQELIWLWVKKVKMLCIVGLAAIGSEKCHSSSGSGQKNDTEWPSFGSSKVKDFGGTQKQNLDERKGKFQRKAQNRIPSSPMAVKRFSATMDRGCGTEIDESQVSNLISMEKLNCERFFLQESRQ